MNIEELKRQWKASHYGTKACDSAVCVAYVTALEAECERLRASQIDWKVLKDAMNHIYAMRTNMMWVHFGSQIAEMDRHMDKLEAELSQAKEKS